MNLEKLPKIALNLNFESSVGYEDIKYYSSLQPDELDQILFVNSNDNAQIYAKRKNFALGQLQLPNKLKKAAYELALKLKKDNVIYAEIVVTPTLHINEGLSFENILYFIRQGFKEAEALNYKILLGALKNEKKDANIELINLYEQYKDDFVCGIAIVGESMANRIPDFKDFFDLLNEKQIPFSFDCGIFDTPEDIKFLIDNNVQRIVGGLNSMIDFSVMGEAVLKRIMFVEQPKALIAKKELASYLDDKLKNMASSGCIMAISIDSLTLENISIGEELSHIVDVQMFSLEDVLKMNKNALIYSFLDVAGKTKYSEILSRFETLEDLNN